MVSADAWTHFRRSASEWLHRLSVGIQPPVDEDPHAWEVSVVKLAASVAAREDAMLAVHQATKHLDEKTIYHVMMLLAADVAWSPGLGTPEAAIEWAELRKFHLAIRDVDDA